MEGAKSKRPKDTAFRQQNLKAWRPILTPKLVILLFLGIGCVFVPIGIAVTVASNSVIEVGTIDYSEACCIEKCDSPTERVDANPCFVNISVPEKMEPPIYMYYKLTNYYQNHRRYVKSRSDMQLRGLDVELDLLDTSCQHRVKSDPDNESTVISPCGLIAWSVFNDSFMLLDTTGTPVDGVTSTGIAWESDINIKFKNAEPDKAVKTGSFFPHFYHERQQRCEDYVPPDSNVTIDTSSALYKTCASTNAGWCFKDSKYCVEDEHFIVWMRTAGLPTFRKLHSRIEKPLEKGTYQVKITNGQLYSDGTHEYYYNPHESADSVLYNSQSSVLPKNQSLLYPVHTFGGTKSIVLSTSSWIGGKNGFLGGAYLTVGIICIVLAAGFALKQNLYPR